MTKKQGAMTVAELLSQFQSVQSEIENKLADMEQELADVEAQIAEKEALCVVPTELQKSLASMLLFSHAATLTPEPEPAPEPVAKKAPEPVAKKAPEPVAKKAPEPVAKEAPEPVAKEAPEDEITPDMTWMDNDMEDDDMEDDDGMGWINKAKTETAAFDGVFAEIDGGNDEPTPEVELVADFLSGLDIALSNLEDEDESEPTQAGWLER